MEKVEETTGNRLFEIKLLFGFVEEFFKNDLFLSIVFSFLVDYNECMIREYEI